MLYVLPIRRLLTPVRRQARFPSSNDITRALHQARAIHSGLREDVAAMLRDRIIAIMLGGVLPLVMLLVFQAPMWSVMLLLASDLALAMVADRVTSAIARAQCLRSLESLVEAEDALETIAILRRQPPEALSPSALQAMAQRPPPEVSTEARETLGTSMFQVYQAGLYFLILLVFAIPHVLRLETPKGDALRGYLLELAPFLLFALAVRVGSAARLAIEARRLDRHGPALLPHAPVATLSLGASGVAVLVLWFVIEESLLGRIGPPLIVLLNVVIGLLLSVYGYRRLKRVAKEASWLLGRAHAAAPAR